MYYGNPSASNNSNGTNTFDFFDDFDGNDINSNRWDIDTSDYSVSSSVFRINRGAIGLVNSLSFNLNDGYVLEGKILYHTQNGGYSGTLSAQSSQYTQSSNGGGDATSLYMRNSGSTSVNRWTGDGSTTGYNCGSGSVFSSSNDAWYILGAEFYSSGVNLSRDRQQEWSYGCGWSENIDYISLGAFHGSSSYDVQDTSYDWVLIRKHVSSEPAYSLGSEEVGNVGWHKWSVVSNPDISSPWSWNFNFPDGTGYYEFYSIGRYDNDVETAPQTADARCHYNTSALVSTSVNPISPYTQVSSPHTISATGYSGLDNVTLIYRYSTDNISWGNNWWSDSYTKRKTINLNVPSGTTPENYTILLNITYDSDMQTDFDDLRFIRYQDNTTELDYWIETKKNSNYANIWLQLQDSITTTDKTHAWMYYGNPTATNNSNGTKTFEFFDDFQETIYDDSKWGTNYEQGIDISDGILSTCNNWNTNGNYFATDTSFSAPMIAQAKARITDLSSDMDLSFGFQNVQTAQWWTNENCVWCLFDSNGGGSANRKEIKTNGIQDSGNEATSSQWETHIIEYLTTGVNYYDTNLGWLNSTRSTISPFYFSIVGDTDSSSRYVYIDYVLLRKYHESTPNYTIGAEEDSAWAEWNDTSNPDINSPWNWSFTFPEGNGYYEFYSIGQKSEIPKETAPQTADARCYYNP
jgi:hypothetical protein